MLIPGYVEADKRFLGVGFLYLDHTIGEYNIIMHIGHIEFRSFDGFPANAHLLTLEELRMMIETEFYLTLTPFWSRPTFCSAPLWVPGPRAIHAVARTPSMWHVIPLAVLGKASFLRSSRPASRR